MKALITLGNRDVTVELSHSAARALSKRDTPLTAEMELFFSCLIRKQVRFHDSAEGIAVAENLHINFHPVMSQHCHVSEVNDDGPPMADFPIVNEAAYTPHWLKLDFRKGQWLGEFGYGH